MHIVSCGIYCSVLEKGGEGKCLISNLNYVRLRFTAASWKKGDLHYISFFTNFALIYWTCLIGFGGKFHRSCNLAHTVRDFDWLVVLWFNATLTFKVISQRSLMFPGVSSCFLTTALTQPSFQWHRLLSWNASTKVKDENKPERKFAWTGYGTHNHQVMSLTRSPPSHPNGGPGFWNLTWCHYT